MKKLTILLLICFAAISANAQLANTSWKAKVTIDDTVTVVFDFGKDVLRVYRFANNAGIENMSYTSTDSTFTIKKIAGQSDCDNEVIGKYKYRIKGNTLSIKIISDPCDDRSHVIENTNWAKLNFPPEVKVDASILKQYAGTYSMDAQHQLTITVENGRLMAESQTNLQAKTPLYALSTNKFSLRMGDITFEFIKGADGKISKFVGYQSGKNYDWKRVK